jgi:hypothetical protein
VDKVKNNSRKLTYSSEKVTKFPVTPFSAKTACFDILRLLTHTHGCPMTDGLLDSIIELEKRIQAEVTAERTRAEEWQAREFATLLTESTDARMIEEAHFRETLAEEEAQLIAESAALEATASAWCQRLLALNDEILRDVLKRHLAAMLPGGDYDHPHGQS